MLVPEGVEYFPDSTLVNEALRSLIKLMNTMPGRKYKQWKSASFQVAEGNR
ncbi:MAG: hypothetical protein HND47_02605 [Chloroflexi bacterium]|nr:hypothetical protein [Chloroflexota bacterium]